MLDLLFQYVKNDDNRYVEFKIAQKALNKAMMVEERQLIC